MKINKGMRNVRSIIAMTQFSECFTQFLSNNRDSFLQPFHQR
jgi:hypothetical protein